RHNVSGQGIECPRAIWGRPAARMARYAPPHFASLNEIRHAAADSRYGNASVVAAASAPPAAAPIANPGGHAALMSPNTTAWSNPCRSTALDSCARAGVQSVAYAVAAATTSAP